MRQDLVPAIEALKGDVTSLEAKLASTKAATNRLCELAGMPPVYMDVDASVSEQRGAQTSIRADQFYGKVMTTAIREYLEMRRAANQGPASPREIYDAILAGGFKFDTDIEINRLTGVRTALRKSSSIFHRLPNNQYGLLAWYPRAKAAPSDDQDGEPAKRTAATAKKVLRPTKPRAPKSARVATPHPAKRQAKKSESAIGAKFDDFALLAMSDGNEWTTAKLKEQALEFGGTGVEETTDLRSLIVRLLALKRHGKIIGRGNGIFVTAETKDDAPAQPGAVIHPFKATA